MPYMRSGTGAVAGAAASSGGGADGWRRCAMGAAGCMFVGMGVGRFSYTTMVPALVTAGALDAVEAGRVGMVNLAGFLVGAVVSVPLARAVGRRRAVLAMLVACLSLLAASALPWGGLWLAACRGGIGVATGLMMVLSLALVAETAPPNARATAAGYMFAGVGLGILASAVLVPLMLEAALWVQWTVLAIAGFLGAGIAAWGWWPAPEPLLATADSQLADGGRDSGKPAAGSGHDGPALPSLALKTLLVAHLLFSVGLVPHTLYWVDFLRRGVGADASLVALSWGLVGVFSFLGPILAAVMARAIGTARALVVAFTVIGLGIALPVVLQLAGSAQGTSGAGLVGAAGAIGSLGGAVLIASSVLFGAQPGLSSLMAARTRDLGRPEAMGRIMRAMILANASGGLAGGAVVPWLYGLGWSQQALFVMGGAAMLTAAVAASPVAAGRDAALR